MDHLFPCHLAPFSLFRVTAQADRLALYRLRHRIFRDELGWLPTHPQGLDYDRYDDFSDNLAAQDEQGQLHGCVRLTAGARPYMLEHEFARLLPAGVRLTKGPNTAEITRLGVLRDGDGRRHQDLARLLYLGLQRWAAHHGVERMYFVVTPAYFERVLAIGFPVHSLGEPREMDGGVLSVAGYIDWPRASPRFLSWLERQVRFPVSVPTQSRARDCSLPVSG